MELAYLSNLKLLCSAPGLLSKSLISQNGEGSPPSPLQCSLTGIPLNPHVKEFTFAIK